ncbi:MAG: hypothetical protein ACKVKT_03620, partial [Rhodospirillales bacterium]
MKKNMNLRAVSAIGALALGTISATATTAEVDTERTIGLVVVSFYTSVYETKYMEECPRGLAIGNDEIWWKSLEPGIRDELTNGGDIEPVTGTRRAMSAKRGPNGEDVCAIPTIVQDPPHKTVQGSISYGMDLDGLSEGAATPKTCSHKNFTSPDGQAGIDNQMYRLLGCTFGWRDSGYVETNANGELIDTSQGVILIEVSDVDDKHNDGDVT